jgi:hypothetical protein
VYSSVTSCGSKITANWYGKTLGRRRPQHELIAGFAATREDGHQAVGIPRWFEPKLEPKGYGRLGRPDKCSGDRRALGSPSSRNLSLLYSQHEGLAAP